MYYGTAGGTSSGSDARVSRLVPSRKAHKESENQTNCRCEEPRCNSPRKTTPQSPQNTHYHTGGIPAFNTRPVATTMAFLSRKNASYADGGGEALVDASRQARIRKKQETIIEKRARGIPPCAAPLERTKCVATNENGLQRREGKLPHTYMIRQAQKQARAYNRSLSTATKRHCLPPASHQDAGRRST